MPTYDFACPAGHLFTRFYRKMSDAATELPCPECGQTAVRKISGGAGLLFKGSGFYITDYGKDGKKNATPAATGESGGGDPKKSESSATRSGGDSGPSSSTASKSESATKSGSAPAERSSGSGAKKGTSTE